MLRPRVFQKALPVIAIVSTNTEVSSARSTMRNKADAYFLQFNMYGWYVGQGVILRQRERTLNVRRQIDSLEAGVRE